MSTDPPKIFTIGHSNHSLPEFVSLLRMHGVTAIADVRSAPYSKFRPDFNREPLRKVLWAEGIHYVFLGEELGARSKDPSCYENGRVQYARLAQTKLFKQGLERVMGGALSYQVALVCAEKEPLFCHRSLLIARALEACGTTVIHIHSNGKLESQEEAMDRLLKMHGLERVDMFRTVQQSIEEAYKRQERHIAYVNEDPSSYAEEI